MTTQISNSRGLTDALIALVQLDGRDEQTIKSLRKFQTDVAEQQRKRNRFVHDGWCFKLPTGEPFRHELSAKGKLVDDLISQTTNEVDQFGANTSALLTRLDDLLSSHAPSPDKHP
jgi:hypothetical protein